MSAYVPSRPTITALVHAAIAGTTYGMAFAYHHDGTRHEVNAETADRTGQMLTDAAVASVKYRYPHDTDDTLPGSGDWREPYTFPLYESRRWDRPSVGFVAKQLANYEYQSCERDDWQDSEALAFCLALCQIIVTWLPEYESAPWGCDEYPLRMERVQKVV